MNTLLKSLNVFPDDSAANASVDLDSHELTDGADDVGYLLGELSGWGNDQSLGVDGGSVDDL